MISGSLFEEIINQIYYKYRFKGIVIFTSYSRIPSLQQQQKNYPRVIKVTNESKEAFEQLHLLIHDTIFRGACKFKDLDHFFGKKHSISYYILQRSFVSNCSQLQDAESSTESAQFILTDYSLLPKDKAFYISQINKARQFVKTQKIALWSDVFEKIDEIGEQFALCLTGKGDQEIG